MGGEKGSEKGRERARERGKLKRRSRNIIINKK